MLELDLTVVVLTIVNFILFMFILNFLLFKPLIKFMDEREKRISAGKKAAVDAQNKIEENAAANKAAVEKCKADSIKQIESSAERLGDSLSAAITQSASQNEAARKAELEHLQAEQEALIAALNKNLPQYKDIALNNIIHTEKGE